MKKISGLNEDASMQYANLYRGVYFIVIHENKKEIIDGLKEFGMYNEYDSPLSNYTSFMLETYQDEEAIGVMRGLEKEKFFAEQNPGEIISFEANYYDEETAEDMVIYYCMSFIVGEHNFYQIMGWTDVKNKQKYQDDLRSLVFSFREL